MSTTAADDRRTRYNPVVATTDFAADFPVFDNADLKVFVDGVERADFAVTATYVDGISTDAKAVFAVGVTGTVDVVGYRDPHRTNRFVDGAPLPPRDINLALDTLEGETQEARRDISQAAKSPYGSAAYEFDPNLADGQALVKSGSKLVSGPTASQIASAAGYAAAAAASRDAAEAAAAAFRVATRTALKALDTTSATTAYLTESGREGIFVWKTGDYSAQIAADTLEGIYIKADAIAATAGAWVRICDEVTLLLFGPSLVSGADVSAALQAAMTMAALSELPPRIHAHPSGYNWTINSSVSVPGITVDFTNSVIETSQNITMFTASASNSKIFNGKFIHNAEGKIVDFGLFDSCEISRSEVVANSSAATSSLVYASGSNIYLHDPSLTNYRTGAFCVQFHRDAGATISINSRIRGAYMGGTGNGVYVSTGHATARVEGLSIDGIKCILTGSEHVTIDAVLEMYVTNSLLDLGSGTNILINPTGSGVQDVSITNNWLSCASNPTGVSGGVNVKSNNTASPATNINIINNRLNLSAYGVALSDNVSDVLVSDNNFSSIDQTDIGGPFDGWTIRNNKHRGTNTQLLLTEGAGGGSVIIDGENFNSGGSLNFTVVNRSRWNFCKTTGKKLINRVSATTPSSPLSGDYLLIPHGLVSAPPISKILVTAAAASGAYTQIIVNVAAVDATNITVQIWHTQVIAGTITVTADCEI